jgi:hypothetical protein
VQKVKTPKMPCWYYEKKELRNTPSIQDGIDYETECRYRKEGARFIIDTGTKMDLGYNTMATGVVYFHRFYMFHSFRSFPRYVSHCLQPLHKLQPHASNVINVFLLHVISMLVF